MKFNIKSDIIQFFCANEVTNVWKFNDLKIREIQNVKSARFRALGIDRAVENAELQDKLEKAQNELRRAQVLVYPAGMVLVLEHVVHV